MWLVPYLRTFTFEYQVRIYLFVSVLHTTCTYYLGTDNVFLFATQHDLLTDLTIDYHT